MNNWSLSLDGFEITVHAPRSLLQWMSLACGDFLTHYGERGHRSIRRVPGGHRLVCRLHDAPLTNEVLGLVLTDFFASMVLSNKLHREELMLSLPERYSAVVN